MTEENIENRLKVAVIDGLRLEDVTPDTIDAFAPMFGDDGLQLDSLDAVELVTIVEKEFGVAIEDADEAKRAFTTIHGLASYIYARKTGL